ncbi:MAG: preprotein translocase subunit YajC [Acetobacteraceae bacterium]|nr:preprotein translocase subunit YajC [Acetobacteraceae bacterium]
MFISSAHAQGFGDLFGGAGGSAAQFLPLIMIFGVFYFLLIRPQQQKQKETRLMIAAVKRGDKIVTGGGILGVVQRVPMVQDAKGNQVPSQEIEVEIAKDIKVTVLRDTITSVIKPVAANDTAPAKGKAG